MFSLLFKHGKLLHGRLIGTFVITLFFDAFFDTSFFLGTSHTTPSGGEGGASGWMQTEIKLKREKMTKAMMMKVSSKPEKGSSINTSSPNRQNKGHV